MSRLNLLYRRSHRQFFNQCRWLRWLNLWKKWETGLSYWGRRWRQYRYMETMHLWRMHGPFLDLAREFLAKVIFWKLFLISDTWLDTWLVFHYFPLCLTYVINQMVHDLVFVLRWVMDTLGKLGFECTKKSIELFSVSPQATLTLFFCLPNFPRTSNSMQHAKPWTNSTKVH